MKSFMPFNQLNFEQISFYLDFKKKIKPKIIFFAIKNEISNPIMVFYHHVGYIKPRFTFRI